MTDIKAQANEIRNHIDAHRDGFAMDRFFFHNPDVYEWEKEKILCRSWLLAGHTSELRNPGAYLQYEIAGESVIVCRDHHDQLHALLNVCRHRGARVCEDAHGNTLAFSCPYHGLTYDLDGALKSAREFEELDRDAYGLFRLPLIEFEGLLFINFDTNAPDFAPELALIAPGIAGFQLGEAKIAATRSYHVAANWKLALENYLECYHCGRAHRAYARSHSLQARESAVATLTSAMMERSESVTGVPDLTAERMHAFDKAPTPGGSVDCSRYALYDRYVTGSEDGKPLAPLMGDFAGYDGGAQDCQFGPLAFMLGYPDHCVLYRFTPNSINSTDMTISWLVRGDAAEGVDYDLEKLTWLWDHTTQEDEYIIRRNAAGVASRFFQPGPYHPEMESLCISFTRWYLQRLAAN